MTAEPRSIAAIERDVLGAMVTGALGLRDVDGLGEHFTFKHHAEIHLVLSELLRERSGRRNGIDLGRAIRACAACDVWPVGATYTDGKRFFCHVGYLPTLAREAPKRREALAACAELRGLTLRKWDVERDGEALRSSVGESLEAVAWALLQSVLESGGIPLRSGDIRPIEPDAIPTRARLSRWLAAVMLERGVGDVARESVAAEPFEFETPERAA